MSSAGGANLPTGWAVSSVGDVCRVVGGGTPATATATYWEGDIAWITSADIQGPRQITPRRSISQQAILESATNLVPAQSVIVATRVGLGKVAMSDAPIAFSQDCHGLLFNREAIDPLYLTYHLVQAVEVFKHVSRGTTINGVTRKQLCELEVVLPPLPEQRRIVAAIEEHFTRLDAVVAALRRVRANLKRYRAAVLKAACEGRLVPTEAALARAEGRDYEPASALLERIDEERARSAGLTPGTRRVAPNRSETSGQPLSGGTYALPEGWVWTTWDRVGLSQNGRAFPSAEYRDDGIRLLRPGNLAIIGRVVWSDENTRCLPSKWEQQFPDHVVGPNEIVMNLTAQSLKDEFLGRVCITDQGEHCLLNQRIARLTPILLDPHFVLWAFKAWPFRRFVDSLNTGSLIQHMFTSQLDGFVLAVPPLAEQRRIVAEVERRLSVVDEVEATVEQQIKRAERLRQAILKRAFAGKLVPQDPNDEPASALLERIRAERRARPQAARGRRGRAGAQLRLVRA